MTGSLEHLQFVFMDPGVSQISRIDSASCFMIHNKVTEHTGPVFGTTCTHPVGQQSRILALRPKLNPSSQILI
jgi:hypothetical protein